MQAFNIWVAGGTCPYSGFEHQEQLRTPEPVRAESFDAAVSAFVDSLPVGQAGLWERSEGGVWTMGGRLVKAQSSTLTDLLEHLDEYGGEEVPPLPPVATYLPMHELWVDSTVTPDDTAALVAMLTPEPIAAETFDDAVQIFIDHLGPAGEADKWEQDPNSGQWAYKGCPVAADEQTAIDSD